MINIQRLLVLGGLGVTDAGQGQQLSCCGWFACWHEDGAREARGAAAKVQTRLLEGAGLGGLPPTDTAQCIWAEMQAGAGGCTGDGQGVIP